MTESGDLLNSLLARRDRERGERERAKLRISAEEAVVETNRNGTMRWYLHPDVPGAAINSTIVYRHEIPPHGATGKQRVQGNVVSFVVQGRGRTVVNGVEHHWEAGDVIGLPPLLDGVVVQHFNDADEEALLITAEPNLVDAFGVDMGSGFEQLEDAPQGGQP